MKRKPFFILIPIAILFVVSGIVMLLWNSILPVVFAVKTINYWQALGILILSKILFSHFSFDKRHRGPFMPPHLKEKFMNMTEEEKQQFKEEWEKRKDEWRKRWC